MAYHIEYIERESMPNCVLWMRRPKGLMMMHLHLQRTRKCANDLLILEVLIITLSLWETNHKYIYILGESKPHSLIPALRVA